MEFRISHTFSDSLTRLTNREQKAVKMTAFDLQLDPSRPGMQFHRITNAKDDHFWSIRISRDLRLIVHKTSGSFLLCYAGHHDDAYAWAERRKIERHPKTGAAQIVELRETTVEIPTYVAVERPMPPVFADVRGRSHTLRINYRTSHQIREHAGRLISPELADVDGIVESRRGTMSVFNGPDPVVYLADEREIEIGAVAEWLSERRKDSIPVEAMGVFVRSANELPHARDAVERL